jgi:hypothetical protein
MKGKLDSQNRLRHMSQSAITVKRRKRTKVEEAESKPSKKSKKETVHLDICNDEDCQGCAEGELDVRFAILTEEGETEVKLSGRDLLKAAMAEREKYEKMELADDGNDEQDGKEDEEVRVIRLYEMAIQQLRDGDKRLLAVALRELGGFVGYTEHLDESITLFKSLKEEAGDMVGEVRLGLGKSLLIKAKTLLDKLDEDSEQNGLEEVESSVKAGLVEYEEGLKHFENDELYRHSLTTASDLTLVATLAKRKASHVTDIVSTHGVQLLQQMDAESDLEGDLDALKAGLMLLKGDWANAISAVKRALKQAHIADLDSHVHVDRMLILVDALLMQTDGTDQEDAVENFGFAVALLEECIRLNPRTLRGKIYAFSNL